MREVVAAFGGNIVLREWFEQRPPGQPGTFDLVMTVSGQEGQPPTAEYVADILAEIDRTKPVRAHYTFTQGFEMRGRQPVGAAARVAAYRRLNPHRLLIAHGNPDHHHRRRPCRAVAAGNGGTNAHQAVEIGLANAPFVADKQLTKLPNELKRIKSFGGANVAPDTIHTTLKDDTADQYSLYGFGLYLENGVLLASYGQATPIMEKSPAAMLLLSSDLQFATIDATKLVFGDASFLNPPATTERQGVVELATQAEVNAGADDACSDAENRGVEICGVDRGEVHRAGRD